MSLALRFSEAYYYQEYSPILSGNLKLNSTNDILKECCCICREEGKNEDLIYCDGCNFSVPFYRNKNDRSGRKKQREAGAYVLCGVRPRTFRFLRRLFYTE